MAYATSVSEYLFEAKARWAGQIGSGGVSDASTQTIPLASTTNLTNGRAYVATINRVDANGVKQNTWETVIGVLSGSNLTNCTRGVEGTAGAWDAGIVIEILFTATHFNKLIDFLGVEHDADGTHDATKIVKMTGNQTIAGVKTFSSSPIVPTPTTDMQAATKLYVDTTVSVTPTSTTTFTNKRITKRITTITSHATPTINTDDCDAVTITAQAEAITSMTTNLSGTPTNFQPLIIRIKDNGTARAITWGASFEAKGVALPTTTVISKVLTVGFLYDTVTSKWGCVASVQEV